MGSNRHLCAGRFAMCKRWPKQVITTDTVRETGGFAVMTSFKNTRELLAGAYQTDIISDKEFVLLYDCSFSKNLSLVPTCAISITQAT